MLRTWLGMACATFCFAQPASAQYTASATCKGATSTVTDSFAVEAMNKDLWGAAAAAKGALARECTPTALAGQDIAPSALRNFGGLCQTSSGYFGRSFRKTSQEEATSAAQDICIQRVREYAFGGKCKEDRAGEKACLMHANVAAEEAGDIRSTAVGKGWLAGLRCREGDGSAGKARSAPIGSYADLKSAIALALKSAGERRMSECRFRSFHDASSGVSFSPGS